MSRHEQRNANGSSRRLGDAAQNAPIVLDVDAPVHVVLSQVVRVPHAEHRSQPLTCDVAVREEEDAFGVAERDNSIECELPSPADPRPDHLNARRCGVCACRTP